MRKRLGLTAYYTAVFLVCLFVALGNPGAVRTTFYSAFFNIMWVLLCLFMIVFHTPSVQSFSIEHAHQDLRYSKDEGMTFVTVEDENRYYRYGWRRRDREFYAAQTAPFAFWLYRTHFPHPGSILRHGGT